MDELHTLFVSTVLIQWNIANALLCFVLLRFCICVDFSSKMWGCIVIQSAKELFPWLPGKLIIMKLALGLSFNMTPWHTIILIFTAKFSCFPRSFFFLQHLDKKLLLYLASNHSQQSSQIKTQCQWKERKNLQQNSRK